LPAPPSRLAVSEYILPPPTVTFGKPTNAHERSRSVQLDRLALLADSIAKNRAKLNGLNERLEGLFRQAESSDATPDELETAASAIFDAEQTAAKSLLPQIEQLERNLARKHPPTEFAKSLRRSAEEALDIGQTWLELYQNLRIRLLKLASDRRVAAGETGSPVFSDAGEMEEYLRRITRG
jgi:hypothetical protein